MMRAGRAAVDAGLEGVPTLGDQILQRRGIASGMLVHADAVAGGAAEEFVDRNAQGLAGQVPQGLLDAAQGAGEDRAAAVEGVPVHGLPVMHDPGRVLADQVGFELGDGLGAGQGAALGDGLAQPDQAFIGVDLEEQPARLDEEGFHPGDLHG